jgi:hypothetical protein
LVKRRSIRIEILLPSSAMDAPALFAFFEFADDAQHDDTERYLRSFGTKDAHHRTQKWACGKSQ